MEARPLRVIPVHEHLRPRLMDLYESDCIFDKFEVSSSTCSLAAGASGSAGGGSAMGSAASRGHSDPGGAALGVSGGGGELAGLSVITGSYNNTLRVYDMGADSETTIELSKTRPRPPTSRGIPALGGAGGGGGGDVAMDGSWGSDGGGGGGFFGYGGGIMGGGSGGGAVDFTKKLLHCSFHPTEPIIAVAGAANLFIYSGL